MPKILFVITQSEIGGAQRYLLELAPYLASRGHQIAIAAGEGDGEMFAEFELKIMNQESRSYHIPHLTRNLNPLSDIRALFSVLKIIKKERPDVLFLQSTKAGFIGSLAAKLFMIHDSRFVIRVVYRIGGWSFCDPRPWWMNQILFWMEKISACWKDVVIVNSEYDRQLALQKRIVSAERVVKIYNGIEPDRLKFLSKEQARNSILSKLFTTSPPSPLLRKERGEKKLLIIGAIANLYATKGIEYLIEAAKISSQLPIINYQLLFVVIGEGKELPKLESLIRKYNLEDTFFLAGRMSNASQYLKAFDVFVLPSVKEGFPWVLLEAMAAEIPIVATSVGAIPEIIEDGKDGFLVPPKNSQALAEKIALLVSIQNSDDRLSFVYSSKEKLKQFSLQKMLEESEKVILG
ncbi:MAG: glycosyltransferase family 4 protein [Candidatus Spechtbacteria bacterium]|nr:glycosyltransferase family 4 protein [Candidatus Spechtbacteria bacterium]